MWSCSSVGRLICEAGPKPHVRSYIFTVLIVRIPKNRIITLVKSLELHKRLNGHKINVAELALGHGVGRSPRSRKVALVPALNQALVRILNQSRLDTIATEPNILKES